MSTTTAAKTETPKGLNAQVLRRVSEEGYGPGAWHGPDLKAALADVTAETAFWRPAPGRHNIAEIALHHAWCVRNVRAQLSGRPAEPFVLEGEDWFEVKDQRRLGWPKVQAALEDEQRKLGDVLAALPKGGPKETERFDLVLGLTCHAVYHAGQVQLLKRLRAE